MSDLWLTLRGMWFRRGTSVAVLVVAALVVGGACTGPLFLRAAGDSVLHDTMEQALPSARIVSDEVSGPDSSNLLATVQQAARRKLARLPRLQDVLGPPVASLQVAAVIGPPGTTGESATLVYRQRVCDHVRMRSGHCPRARGQVMISAGTAAAMGWHLGEGLVVDQRRVTVSGLYDPVAPTGDYWGTSQYFAAFSGSGVAGSSVSSLDAVFATRATLEAQPGNIEATAGLERRVRVAQLRLVNTPALQKELLAYLVPLFTGNGQPVNDNADTAMTSVLQQAREIANGLVLPVDVVEAQLLALAWLVLFLVVANAAEARGPEVALAKLRGASLGSTLAFGLLDSVLLVLVAVPTGFALGWAAVRVIAAVHLAPGTPVVITPGSLVAAAAAGAGAVAAAVLATSGMLRRPVVEQWRRANRRGRPRSWIVDAVLVAATVAGLVVLARRGAIGSGRTTVLALAVPGLLVVAAALLGSRLLPALCRAAAGPTRRPTRLAWFLAVRQLGRRPSTLRLALVLAVAFGLVTFGVDAWSVARGNQHDRAWLETGAAEVLTVSVPPGRDIGKIVDHLDPTGHRAVAVTEATDYNGPVPVQLLAVQPDRFARIAFWRPDFSAASLPSIMHRLTTRVAPPVPLTGDRLEVSVHVPEPLGRRPPLLVAYIAQQGAGLDPVTLGRLAPGSHDLRARIPCEQSGCRLAGLHLDRPGVSFYRIRGRLTVHAVRVHDQGVWRTRDADLGTSGGWRAAGNGATAASTDGRTLTLHVDAPLAQAPTWQVADWPQRLPALVGAPAYAGAGPRVAGLSDEELHLDPVAHGSAIPGAGVRGVVVDRTYAERAAFGASTFGTDTVWVTGGAATAFKQRLRRAGVSILATASGARQTAIYQRQGPALAVLLFLVGAALGCLLAAGGAVITLHIAGRRRTYEMAAMEAFGLRRRALFASLFAEQALLAAFGVAVGVGAGVVGALLALPAVPEFADTPTAPPLLYGVRPLPVLVTVAVTVLVLGAVIAINAAALLRASRPDQLREAPA